MKMADFLSSPSISPWFINGAFVNPESAYIHLDSQQPLSGLSVFSTGTVISALFLGGKYHIQRLIKDSQALLIECKSAIELQETLTIWCQHLRYETQPIKAKIIIGSGIAPIFTAHAIGTFPEVVTLLYNPKQIIPKLLKWSRIKMSARVEYRFLHASAQQKGYDDALLLDSKENIIETTNSAFWFISNETLFYPDPDLGGIDSITKRALITSCMAVNYPTEKWRGSLDQIPKNSRCYISNCVRGIQAVSHIGDYSPFPIDLQEKSSLQKRLTKNLLQAAF